jgi:hypothetical protein
MASDGDTAELRRQCESVADTVRAYARQIETGEYGGRYWVFINDTDDLAVSDTVDAANLDAAIDEVSDMTGLPADSFYAELDEAYDDPTVNETSIYDYPLAVVDERGREFAVVICTGGPHIEVVADGLNRARLEGYWWGSRCTLTGDYFDTFLDWFIERD